MVFNSQPHFSSHWKPYYYTNCTLKHSEVKHFSLFFKIVTMVINNDILFRKKVATSMDAPLMIKGLNIDFLIFIINC